MKTRIIRNWSLALTLAGLPFLAENVGGDDSGSAGSNTAAPATSMQPPQSPPASAPTADPTPAPAVKLSPGAAEIVKLAQAGVGEDVMLAYVGNVKIKFSLGSDQIVFLNDLGVTGAVVKAMILHDDAIDAAARDYAMTQLQPTVPPPPANPYPTAPTDDGSQPSMPPPDNSVSPPDNTVDYPVSDDSDYFYNSLAPYGSWVYLAGFGLCWQPTACILNHEWRPYGDHGRWLYSDCGWYWQSDYSWGWAAFHYGRWFADAKRGWVWAPGRVWAPAWVSWRRSEDYCGWAPLPPSAKFFPGSGLAYANHLVGANFEFGLQPNQYTFIPLARMSDYTPVRYSVTGSQAAEVAARTAVINRYSTENNRVVHHGIAPEEVAVLARTEIRRASVLEMPRSVGESVQSDRLSKQGGSLIIYRPQLPTPSARRGPAVVTPARNIGNTKTSQNESSPITAPVAGNFAAAKPIYMSGATPPFNRAENYPRGSLVVIGQRNPANTQVPVSSLPNMKFSRPASVVAPSQPQPEALAEATPVAAGFNFGGNNAYNANYARPAYSQIQTPQAAAPAGRITYVIPAHYSVSQQLNANSQRGYAAQESASVPERSVTERPVRESRAESGIQSHPVETRAIEAARTAQTSAAAHYESAPANHASSSSASSSTSGKH